MLSFFIKSLPSRFVGHRGEITTGALIAFAVSGSFIETGLDIFSLSVFPFADLTKMNVLDLIRPGIFSDITV